ncbi:hypothetical protein [Aquimarina algiphila]|uniref:Uncharacterized protein n=1 Tax=Aquimarina algiphila TaxID=2047982 RepID=A0A554VB39_9FLAO|nr:hypothetical protein [Aquimarina algiphila]TSE03522.1 hypothetical protein FOF46_28975 [Aquimarina algiphila]
MHNTFDKKTKAFERAISTMQADLQQLANKGNVSDRFIAKQNRILKSLIEYYNESQYLIDNIQDQLKETQIANNRHREQLTDRIIQFEAICILHGILDFPYFLSYSKHILIDWAIDLHNDEKGFMLTDMMKTYVKELPEKDRTTVETILFRRINQRIEGLLNKMNDSRKKPKE